jgi:F-type H+-transporting ATPase subunit gamma
MAGVLDIRRRIRSVRNTRQITRAMKMVSAARLRRAQERALTARPYSQMLTNVLKSLVSRAELIDPATGELRHPLLVRREEKNVLLIVVTGDRGLAGPFNTNILKAAARFIQSKTGKNIDIETVGRKGRDYFKRRYPMVLRNVVSRNGAGDAAEYKRQGPIEITGELVGVLNRIEFSYARELAENVIERYVRGEVDSVFLVFNEFKSVIAQRLIVEEILPIGKIGEREIRLTEELSGEARRQAAEAAATAGVGVRAADTRDIDARAAGFAAKEVDYIYEQPPAEIFRDLLPKYVGLQIYRALLESVAAEHAARMTAMDSATNNANDMIDSLTLAMNRVRQAKITKEIIEIVSGAAAL